MKSSMVLNLIFAQDLICENAGQVRCNVCTVIAMILQ